MDHPRSPYFCTHLSTTSDLPIRQAIELADKLVHPYGLGLVYENILHQTDNPDGELARIVLIDPKVEIPAFTQRQLQKELDELRVIRDKMSAENSALRQSQEGLAARFDNLTQELRDVWLDRNAIAKEREELRQTLTSVKTLVQ